MDYMMKNGNQGQQNRLKRKEISSRLIKPTHPQIQVPLMIHYARNWHDSYELEGEIVVYDEGLAQYALCDRESHHKYYAALLLNKPSLRCSLAKLPPHDFLDESNDNTIELYYDDEIDKSDGRHYADSLGSVSNQSSPVPTLGLDEDDRMAIDDLKALLRRRGFRIHK